MKNDEPIVKGGCGHSDKDVENSAIITSFVFLLFLVLMLISLLA